MVHGAWLVFSAGGKVAQQFCGADVFGTGVRLRLWTWVVGRKSENRQRNMRQPYSKDRICPSVAPQSLHNKTEPLLLMIVLFPGSAITKKPWKHGLKPQHILSRFWRAEVQNQCVSRAMLPLKTLGKQAAGGPWSIPFIRLRKFPSFASWLRSFIMNWWWILSNGFSGI